MDAYFVDWINALVRWAHVIAGIAWIGSSFYFIWFDNHLEAPRRDTDGDEDISGEVWSVHGGGFYRGQKFRVAPETIPGTLHWFKWEAYWTWLSGMVLLLVIYWYGAEIYLVDPNVAQLSPWTAVAIAAAFIFGGWVVYDALCKTRLVDNQAAFGAVLFVLSSFLAWGLCQLFSGRAAYIHFGVVLGTIMAANVFFVIIPAQRITVAAGERGYTPDPVPGIRAKQRSVHNTYFTLPVLFVMTSNHFAVSYGHEYNWVILIGISLAGALIRIYCVARHKGRASLVPLWVALVLLAGVAAIAAPRRDSPTLAETVQFSDVRMIIHQRCSTCHSHEPTFAAFPAPPGGVALDTDAQILAEALRIHQQTVVTHVMPIGNLTGITEEERGMLDAWYLGMKNNP